MRLEIGNKVAVLDDVLKGVVTDVSDNQVIIETEDGMKFSFLASELVRIDKDQHELSKFSDINNPLLKEKTKLNSSKKSLFKKDKNEVELRVHACMISQDEMINVALDEFIKKHL